MHNNIQDRAVSIGYKGKCVAETVNTKFLGLQIANHLN